MSDDLRALSEAATPAPWTNEHADGTVTAGIFWRAPETQPFGEYLGGMEQDTADAALIVALRNAIASGDLITREEAGQMVRDALAQHDERLHEAAKAWARFKEDEYVDPDGGVIDGSDYAEPNIVQLFDLLFGTTE